MSARMNASACLVLAALLGVITSGVSLAGDADPPNSASAGAKPRDEETKAKLEEFRNLLKEIDAVGTAKFLYTETGTPPAGSDKRLDRAKKADLEAKSDIRELAEPLTSDLPIQEDGLQRLQRNQRELTQQRINDLIILETNP